MRDQSKAEIVFVLVRVLVTGRLLWGGGLSLANLPPLLRASSRQVSHALDDLRDEGMVFVDPRQGTVHLTERAFRELSE
jgi:DNA-binding GntR family transcriptional regulator